MKAVVFCLAFLLPICSIAQMDTAFIAKLKSLDTANMLKLDTATVPNDPLTAKIKQLRSEKKGLTLETIIKMKLAEQQQSNTTHSKDYYDKLMEDVTKGKTSKLIENSLINLYRNNFTEPEIDELIKFYQTSAGKKMDKEYILLMVESMKDAEQLIKLAAKNVGEK